MFRQWRSLMQSATLRYDELAEPRTMVKRTRILRIFGAGSSGWNGMKASQTKQLSALRCFLMGFVTNALNPKAVLFFLSLFSALVSHETPILIQAGYGMVMTTALISLVRRRIRLLHDAIRS